MKNKFSSLVRWSLLLFALLCGTSLYAQRTITGTVIDGSPEASGEPLIGASVHIKGTTTGTATDVDGSFSISARNSDVIVISMTGYMLQEIPVGNQSTLRVTLGVDVQQLDEMVVVGFTTVKKSDLTGAVALVGSKELTKTPATNTASALQGKAPGVLIVNSGSPGVDPAIRVRGIGSISRNPNPIFVVDGVIVGGIGNIAPQDIEAISVLKDASAAAIYGANGANGVVIVTTKRGKSGKPQVNFNAFGSVTLAPEKYGVMNASEYAQFYNEIKYPNITDRVVGGTPNAGYALSDEFRQAYYGQGWEKGTDWQDGAFRNGYQQNYNLSVSGGGDKSNYSFSLGYVDEQGTIISTGFDRFNLRANSDFSVGKWVKMGESFSLSRGSRQSYNNTSQTSIFNLNQSPLMRVYNPYPTSEADVFESYQQEYYYDASGILKPWDGVNPQHWSNTLSNDKPNTLVGPKTSSNMRYSTNVLLSAYFEVNLGGKFEGLSYKFTPSAEGSFARRKNWQPRYTGNRSGNTATLAEEWSESITLGVENQITYKKSFNKKHNLNALVVHQMRKSDGNSANVSVSGFPFETLNTLSNYDKANDPTITGYYNPFRMVSYLARAQYDYKERYLITASIRADGVSRFAPGNRWGYFPSVSAGWKLNEDLMPEAEVVDMLKLRLGWGKTGNSDIGNFAYLSRLTGDDQFSPVFGDDQTLNPARYMFASFGYPGIKWEAADMYNFGADLQMFDQRFQFSAEYYIKQQNDLLAQVQLTAVYGLDGNGARPWMNLGKLRNQGFEFNASWRDSPRAVKDFSYGASVNLTTIKNEVRALPSEEIAGNNTITRVGRSIGELYGYISEGVIQASDKYYERDANGDLDFTKYKFAKQEGNVPQPGDLKFKDLNKDGIVNDLDRTQIGKSIPDFTYSLNLDFGYKGLDLSLFFYGVQNFDIYNQQRASMSSIEAQNMDHNKFSDYARNYYTIDRPTKDYVNISNVNNNGRLSTFWVENGSFLRLKDLQLGYSLPEKATQKLLISNARIYFSAQNLFTITKYKGRDPEACLIRRNDSGDVESPLNNGTDDGVYPIPKTFSLGLQIGF